MRYSTLRRAHRTQTLSVSLTAVVVAFRWLRRRANLILSIYVQPLTRANAGQRRPWELDHQGVHAHSACRLGRRSPTECLGPILVLCHRRKQ